MEVPTSNLISVNVLYELKSSFVGREMFSQERILLCEISLTHFEKMFSLLALIAVAYLVICFVWDQMP